MTGPDRGELERLAWLLGGELTANGAVRCPGPDRPDDDRIMVVRFDDRLEDGFIAACIAVDYERDACREIVHAVLAQHRFEHAAAEARDASRRYWAPGGPADRKYPVLPSKAWPEPVPAVAGSTAVAIEDANDRLRRRRR